MAGKPLPLNRVLDQLIRDGHLTFRKKCRDLVMQIFGHEGLVAESDTQDIAHCTVFDADFYRLNTLSLKHLALRKLLNPFKWLEFLLVAPLELLSWGIQRGKEQLYNKIKGFLEDKGRVIKVVGWFFIFVFEITLRIASIVTNIAVNFVTGVARCFLAPARYVVRPAIEMLKKYPKTFYTVLAITLGVTAALAVLVFTGGLPLALAGLFFAGSLAAKLAILAFASVALGVVLTKTVNKIREFFSGLVTTIKINFVQEWKVARNSNKQMAEVDERNQQLGYRLKFMTLAKTPSKKDLDQQYKAAIPLLIEAPDGIWIYGSQGEGTKLTRLRFDVYAEPEDNEKYLAEYKKIFLFDVADGEVVEQVRIPPELEIYEDINRLGVRGHSPIKTGSTEKITEALHAIDIDHAEVVRPEDQGLDQTLALTFGLEAVFFPKKMGEKAGQLDPKIPQEDQKRCLGPN